MKHKLRTILETLARVLKRNDTGANGDTSPSVRHEEIGNSQPLQQELLKLMRHRNRQGRSPNSHSRPCLDNTGNTLAPHAMFEALESRQLLSVSLQFDYSFDSNGFFATQSRRDTLESAASMIEARLNDDLTAIQPSGGNSWVASFTHPATGVSQQLINLQVPANTLIVYVGGRSLGGGTLGEGGPGGFSTSGSAAFNNTVTSRGEPGALTSPKTDFAPWGGSLAFDTSSNWYFGQSESGLASNQNDFISVALHELSHLLGFGTSQMFNSLVVSGRFTGDNATAAFDGVGSPPVDAGGGHWAAGLIDNGLEVAMGPAVTTGTRKLLTELDFAALKDLGWEVSQVPLAEITVLGNNLSIADGDISPTASDHTDFGSVTQGGAQVSRTFTARNDGNATLTINGLAVSTGFTITEGLSTSLAPGASDTFTVQLDTTSPGTKSGQISFNTNDSDENPFNYNIAGIVLASDAVQTTTRISVASNGVQGNGGSFSPSISADGRFVAFQSLASYLVPGDTNLTYDIFVHDRQNGQTGRVSIDSNGTQSNGLSGSPTISADGRYVAFRSTATNLVTGDTNNYADVFVHDRITGETTRVSISNTGTQGNALSEFPTISNDGRYVVFRSFASNLVPGDTNGVADIFVHDREIGHTTRASVNGAGAQGNGISINSTISSDGRYVAYRSDASNLVSDDNNNAGDVFVHDRLSGQTTRVSINSAGVEGNGISLSPSISSDGRYVAFESTTSNLVAGDTNNNTEDIFVHDRETGQTTRVSVDSLGIQSNVNGHSSNPSISSDGRYVAFESYASNLVIGDTNQAKDIFLHDRLTGQTTRISVDSVGAQGNLDSANPSISGNGQLIAFDSSSNNLVAGDTNGTDIFVHNRGNAIISSLPEVTVLGNSQLIGDGDTTPSSVDHTDFGSVFQGGTAVSRTFTVRNDGTATLTTSGLIVPTGFTITEGLSASIAPSASDTFTVRMDTITAGTKSGQISFNTNDGDENPLNFSITGSVSAAGSANDTFANRTVIAGSSATVTGTNIGASKEVGEPSHGGNAGGASVWWTWTAPASGTVEINTIGSSFGTFLGVYIGTTIAALTEVAGDDNGGASGTSSVHFNVVADTTYQIAVDGYNGQTGNITLNVMSHLYEVTLLGNSQSIGDGDAIPSTVDHTDFGSVFQGGPAVSRTFTVRNDGIAGISTNGLTVPAGFTITENLVSFIAPGASDTFTVRLDTASVGTKSGQISFTINYIEASPFNFSITGVVSTSSPEVTVVGNSVNISDGDATPSVSDHTDFGSVAQGAAGLTRTFTVRNDGSATLNLSGLTLPTGYSLVEGLPVSLVPGLNDTFTVRLDTTTVGTKTGQISFTTNDSDENPFNFTITGVVSAAISPEVSVLGNGVNITDGDTTPSMSDGTDFGTVAQGGAAIIRTFTVQNTGSAALTLGTVTLPTGFSLDGSDPLTSTITAGGSDTFKIRLDTTTAGTKSGQINFTTNDSDENPFNFIITGVVSASLPEVTVVGNSVNISDGDATPSTVDHTDFGSLFQGGTTISRTFTVRNDGNATLTTGGLTVPAGFTITEGVSVSLAPGASDTFTVRMDTATAGTKSGQISFTTNDSDENPFNFSVSGAVIISNGLVATTRVSVDSTGTESNGFSRVPSISDDGRYVAFSSAADNLVVNDMNGVSDVFVHDRQTGHISRASVGIAGTEGNASSFISSISADGRYVAFTSDATNLVVADTNSVSDVFVHDRHTGQTSRVSVNNGGAQSNGSSSLPSISADGRYVAFTSDATNLVTGDTNSVSDVFVHDRQSGQTTRVNVTNVGTQGNDTSSLPSISADGRYVAFVTSAINLAFGDSNNAQDIFVHDRQTGMTNRVSINSDAYRGNSDSVRPSISADGRYVAFDSAASNLVAGDTNNAFDVFVHDIQTGQTTRVSVGSNGAQGNSFSRDPSISHDGRYVAFWSDANNLAPDDSNLVFDIFIHDRETGQTTLASVSTSGEQGNASSSPFFNSIPSISADGRYVAFESIASNLVENDTNNTGDIFVYDRSPTGVPSTSPEVTVLGNGVSIIDGDTTPSAVDQTDFGSVTQGGSAVTRTFTVRNDGTATLTTSGLIVPTGFTITEGLSASIAPGASDTLTVRLDTASVGTKSGQISFTTNDSDESPFNFSITGVVIAASTSNNTFANRTTIAGTSATVTGTNIGASKETGEPHHAGNSGGASAWWTWTAPATGTVQINTIGSNFDTTLGVYTGSTIAGLTEVAGNDDSGGATSLVTFNVVAGTNYQVAVDGFSGATGNITLNVNLTPSTLSPEVTVLGNSQSIGDGDTTPSTIDQTDFGSMFQGGTVVSRTFTVRNDGNATLTTGGLTVPAGFTITEGLLASIAPGSSDTFTVRMDTATAGAKSGQISFTTNDANENPFNYSITGTINVVVGSGGHLNFAANQKVLYTDSDGTIVSISIKNGIGLLDFIGDDINFNPSSKSITVTGNNIAVSQFLIDDAENTTLTVTTKGGDGRATFGGLTVDGSAGSIKMPGVDIEGNILVTGLVKNFVMGAVTGDAVEQRSISLGGAATDKASVLTFTQLTDVALSSDAPVQVTVFRWSDTDPQDNPDSLTAPYATTLSAKGDAKNKITGHWAADVTLTGEGVTKDTLKTFKAQSLSDSIFEIAGAIGTFDVSKGIVENFALNAEGDVKTVKLGNVSDSSLTAQNVGRLQALRWLGGQVTADTIKTFKIIGDKKTALAGDTNASLTIEGDPAAKTVLGSATIAGQLTGQWQIAGPVGTITAGDVDAFTGNVAGAVNAFNSKAAFSGLLAAFSFAKIDIKTHLTDAKLIAGDNVAGSFINSLKIGGDMTNSSIFVGVDPVNAIFGDGDDLLLGGITHLIKALTIGGTTDTNAPKFFAGIFPKSVTINKLKVDPLTDARFSVTPA